VYAIIDKLDRTPVAVSTEKLAALGLSAAAVARIATIASVEMDEVKERLAGSEAETYAFEFEQYLTYVSTLLGGDSSWLRLDLSIVRGLAYYTGIVFELFDRSGEFRAICGGGRYDALLKSLGGADMPAVGFGMGDVVLGELLRAKGLMRATSTTADYWLAADESTPLDVVMAEAATRRAAGHSVEYSLRPQTISKQKKAAQASGAREFISLTHDASNG
jgi:histidyl-tRNA synthetase